MKLIGITGMSGAGKTTLSNLLAKNSKVGVIHIDDISNKMKLKYFRLIMHSNNKGEKIKVNSKLKKFIYTNKIIFNLFMKFKAKLVEKTLNNRIAELKDMGKQIVLIDDSFIKYYKCYNDISQIFVVKRPFLDRRNALKKRDKLTKADIVARDIAHFKGIYRELKGKNVVTITNTGDVQKLEKEAEKISEKYFSDILEEFVDVKERYFCKTEGPKVQQRCKKINRRGEELNEKSDR